MAHAECLTVSLTERSTVRLTGSLFCGGEVDGEVDGPSKCPSRCPSRQNTAYFNKLHRHRPQIEKVGTDGSQRGNQRLRVLDLSHPF